MAKYTLIILSTILPLFLGLASYREPVITPTDIRFIVLGDMGTGDSNQKAVAKAVAKKCKLEDCQFVVLLGDNFYKDGVESTSDRQWKTKFATMFRNTPVPFYAVLGNHDRRGSTQAQIDYSKVNSKWIMPNNYYNFSKDNVDFIAVDSHKLLVREKHRIQQDQYYKELMPSLNGDWKILLTHHPYISDSWHGNMGNYEGTTGRGLGSKAIFNDHFCGKIDLYLQAHDHNLQVLKGPKSCPGTFVVSGGGGGRLYDQKSRDANQVEFFKQTFGFTYIQIIDSCIAIEMIKNDGKILHTKNYCK
ncbi:MAG: metallophosphoesterase [SAR324 cluster bacterium]|nr:metallophosphoesterase [SAR324 cluster bacterium]